MLILAAGCGRRSDEGTDAGVELGNDGPDASVHFDAGELDSNGASDLADGGQAANGSGQNGEGTRPPCEEPTPLSSISGLAAMTGIAVARDGTVGVTYSLSGELHHASNATGEWVQEAIDHPYLGQPTVLAFGPDGSAHIAHVMNRSIAYLSNATGEWEIDIGGTGRDLRGTLDLRIDEDGAAHLVFANERPDRVAYRSNATGTWEQQTVAEPGRCGALDIDAEGVVHVAFCRVNSELPNQFDVLLARQDGADEYSEELLAEAVAFSTPVYLGLASDGTPHILFRALETNAVTHLTRESGEYVQTHLSEDTQALDLAVAPNGDVHVLHGSQFVLRYSTNASGTWEETTLEPSFPGGRAAIAIGDDGRIYIAYVGIFQSGREVRYGTMCP